MISFDLPSQGFSNCFGCSKKNERGLKLRIKYSDEGCFAHYIIPNELCGFMGVAHGGVIATLLDEIAAWTLMTQLFRVGMTVELSIQYLKRVPTNEEVTIKGEIIEHDDKTVFVRSAIYSTKTGTLLAEGKSKWLLPKYSTIAKVLEIDASEFEKTMEEFINPLKKYILEQRSNNKP
ncbi:MAG: PaaI family thioesterase [Promethearchaeota archaeon]